jgi:hypothetical protein
MPNVFFIMPFRPGLNFMFLHMKHFIEANFDGTNCVRGDTTVSTGMLINKIRSNIEEADVVIADCSGGNPNVFYELGVAHALGKQVVLIHDSSYIDIPTDIQGYERLPYGFNDDMAFCANVESALRGIIQDKYDILYDKARLLMEAYNRESGKNVPIKDAKKFHEDLKSRENAAKLPPQDDERKLAAYLIPITVDGVLDLEVATELKSWVDRKYPPRTQSSGGGS